jgi:hypothetical protein
MRVRKVLPNPSLKWTATSTLRVLASALAGCAGRSAEFKR